MTDGIYTLANDAVYDQLVALLNSIEVNAGADFPVCVIAYDRQLDRVRAEIASRPSVTLLEDAAVFARWEDFSQRVWSAHPTALAQWQARGIAGVYRLSCNHRYAAFDPTAPFDRFVYLDADTLLLDSPQIFFDALDRHDFVVYDFQFKDPSHIFNLSSPRLSQLFSPEQLETQIFCSGCFAAKRSMFPARQRDWLIEQLAAGDADVLYLAAPNQSVLNYMTLRSQTPVHNLAIHLPPDRRTGNSVTSAHFQERDHLLYDRDRRLTYLHYIGLGTKLFRQVCAGENLDFPYRDLFLHYRYLKQPDRYPAFVGRSKPYSQPLSLPERVLRKLRAKVQA